MQLLPIKTVSDFNNTVVPVGSVLILITKDDNGRFVRHYKDSNGNVRSM